MTRSKIHKITRHSEYYSLDKNFDDLYRRSKNGCKNFTDLYDRIFSRSNICLAFRNIKSNKGSKTPGLDRINIKKIKTMALDQVVNNIQNMAKEYKPSTVRRIWIPKANGKKRPIGIPILIDRIFQQCVKQVIEPICEAKFYDHSYGFRPNRSTKHALARSAFLINRAKLHYVVDVDIKSFFDTINHGKLLKQCWTLGIRDKRIISIISKMLKAEVQGEGVPSMGTPQGGILSPLFSNICLNELDWWLSNQWASFSTKFPYKSDSSRFDALRKRSSLKEFHVVRYADDFKIFCRDYKTARKIFIATEKWLKERLKLNVSAEKSSITNLRKKSSPFLGILLRARPEKGKNLVCRSRIQPKALEEMQKTLKSLIVKLRINPSPSNILLFNSTVLGYQNYYNCATDCSIDFRKIGFVLSKTIFSRLRNIISSKGYLTKTFIKRYKSKSKTNFINGIALFPISLVRHKKLMQFSPKMTPYTKEGRLLMHKELDSLLKSDLKIICIQTNGKESMELNDNRISRWSAQRGKCSVSKVYLGADFHCHHIVPRSKGGSDAFSNLVIVSEDIHRLIHAVSPWVIRLLKQKVNLDSKALLRLNNFRVKAGLNPLD